MVRTAGWSFWLAGVAILAAGCRSAPPPCPATPVHNGPVGRQDVATAPWVLAEPASAGIFAYFVTGLPKVQSGSEIRWIVDGGGRGETLELLAVNITNHEDLVRASLPRDGAISTDYPGLLKIPSAGCWEFDVKTGTLSGNLTLAIGE